MLTVALFVINLSSQVLAEPAELGLSDSQLVKLQGEVFQLQGEILIMEHNQQRIRVDIGELTYSSLSQNINKGDQVYVAGFTQRNINAHNPIIIAERITLLEVQHRSDMQMNPVTGQPVKGELIPKIQRNTRQKISQNAHILEGRILNIRGRNLMVQTDRGTVSVNIADLGLDPTGAYVEPALERGDRVELLAATNIKTGRTHAEQVLAVKKSCSSTVH